MGHYCPVGVGTNGGIIAEEHQSFTALRLIDGFHGVSVGVQTKDYNSPLNALGHASSLLLL
jgi:hypothetical protein